MWRVGIWHTYSDTLSLDFNVGLTPESTIIKFYRLEMNSTLYYSTEYTRAKKTNNYTVVYKSPVESEEKFALIDFFLEMKPSNSPQFKVIAVVRKLITTCFTSGDVAVSHLHVISSEEKSFIPVQWIRQKCVLIQQSPLLNGYVARPHGVCSLFT